MAFLNNSEIYIEAILTDYGRKVLAEGNGAFNVVKFSVSDDDIDYSMWDPSSDEPDKNIVNLPILEPISNEDFAINCRLLTIDNPNIKYMPIISAPPNITVYSVKNLETHTDIACTIMMANKDKITSELVDSLFKITVDNNFLYVVTSVGELIPYNNISIYNLASYIVEATETINAYNARDCKFGIKVKNISDDIWTNYGVETQGGIRHIYTSIKIEGINSGLQAYTNVDIIKEV